MTEEEIDALVKAQYEARSRTREPYSDERWAHIKQKFPGSVRICRADVMEQVEGGDWD